MNYDIHWKRDVTVSVEVRLDPYSTIPKTKDKLLLLNLLTFDLADQSYPFNFKREVTVLDG